jgi:hypothetical protein
VFLHGVVIPFANLATVDMLIVHGGEMIMLLLVHLWFKFNQVIAGIDG